MALELSAKIGRDTNSVIRPPLWLTIFISFFYGMMTFSWASTRHENLWMLGMIISTICFLVLVAFYLYSSHLLGVKPKLMPKVYLNSSFIYSVLYFLGQHSCYQDISALMIFGLLHIWGLLSTLLH